MWSDYFKHGYFFDLKEGREFVRILEFEECSCCFIQEPDICVTVYFITRWLIICTFLWVTLVGLRILHVFQAFLANEKLLLRAIFFWVGWVVPRVDLKGSEYNLINIAYFRSLYMILLKWRYFWVIFNRLILREFLVSFSRILSRHALLDLFISSWIMRT